MPDYLSPHDYSGPFAPLPDEIRERHPNMLAWEFDKTYPEPDKWEPRGWHVVLPDGVLTYNLHGLCVRDRVLYT